jgi:hypothetical protein
MRSFKDYRICRESWESASAAGVCNPRLVLLYGKRRRRFVLKAGGGDDVYCWCDGRGADRRLLVLSLCSSLGYMGLSVYDWQSCDEIDGGPFLQNAAEEFEGLRASICGRGRPRVDPFDYSPAYIAGVLYSWFRESCC